MICLLHGLVAVERVVIGNQVPPDGDGISDTVESQRDKLAVRLAGTAGLIMVAGRGEICWSVFG
jgi:hypothetical protein